MQRLNLAGWTKCGAFAGAKNALLGLSALYPNRIAVNVHEHATRDEYLAWLTENRDSFGRPNHKTSPFIWKEDGSVIGGRDDVLEFCRRNMSEIADIEACPPHKFSIGPGETIKNVDAWNPNHGFDYDLVVIGGGSGGLACSKEAQKQGAKVAVLDFVKPSPQGSSWGLGGTCVNVGCIPKKLMHHAAELGASVTKHASEFGWEGTADAKFKHNWDTLRDNVQDHIKGLNFGYRVQLRDEGVTYLNKLAKFVDANTIECSDKKGRKSIVTAARFVIAAGGRPTLPDVPGGEYAITSDDLFSMKEPPGKTCVLGAGYVALECAGFITGLKQGDVTVLVRSVPLRTFDRDVVDKITKVMEDAGTKIIVGVLPTSIEKIPATEEGGRDQFKVTYSNGDSDVFDTVLCAIGRRADTAALGLAELGVKINDSNGKIIATNEQTTVPNIYAIGDVVDKTPELTPVAIMAGRLLARRLTANASGSSLTTAEREEKKLTSHAPEYMDYDNIATAVFTPLELGTVGLSEAAAVAKYGEDDVDVYISSFTPLEHTLLHLEGNPCLAKVVVNRKDHNRVLGIHIAAPNAGEIIQGYAVAVKKGITYADLASTVGIHPTVTEELVTLSVTKRSGANADKSGC